MQDFTVHLKVQSVEIVTESTERAVLVKAGARLFGRPAWEKDDVTVFFVCAPGHAPTPGDELKVSVIRSEPGRPSD